MGGRPRNARRERAAIGRAARWLAPLALALLSALVGAGPALAVGCGRLAAPDATVSPEIAAPATDSRFTVCEVTADEDLRLFLNGPDGAPYGSFARLRRALAAQGERLLFAMNAGMYHPDRRAVGLYLERGQQLAPLVTRAGPGNFGMLPNGVFCIGPDRLRVIESRRFAAKAPACRYATQSGPMLLIGGELHPRFLPDSSSRAIRNGVGVSPDGRRAWFVISDRPVTFYEMAIFLRDRLGVRDALYLDGSISKLYARGLGREDLGRPMGPILGVVAPLEDGD